MSERIVYVVNDPSFFMSHRYGVAKAALDAGYEVHVVTGPGGAVQQIAKSFHFHQLSLSRSGLNPFNEVKTVLQLIKLFRRIKPHIIHLVTIKPSIYGGIAARITKAPGVVFAISGLGSVFVSTGVKAWIVKSLTKRLYRTALKQRNKLVIFQNPDDEALFVRLGAVEAKECRRIRGSGVDLERFPKTPEPDEYFRVTFAARLLKEKGIVEFIEAVKILNAKNINAEYVVLGDPDPGNPSSVTLGEVKEWEKLSNIRFLGFQENIPEWYLASNIIVLPSYREGLPKSLIEAAAAGRAVVTTNVPGCRDAIEVDKTGLLVAVRDAVSLAEGIYELYANNSKRIQMGLSGRELAEQAFTLKSVIGAHLSMYQELLILTRDSGEHTGVRP